jgi:DNA-binding protein YbaB
VAQAADCVKRIYGLAVAQRIVATAADGKVSVTYDGTGAVHEIHVDRSLLLPIKQNKL